MSRAPQGSLVLQSAKQYLQRGNRGHLTSGHARPSQWSLSISPNIDDWQLGDLVRMAAHDSAGAALMMGQWVLFPAQAQHVRWVHCGIYVGDGDIVDAMPRGGVQRRPLQPYVKHRAVQIRRLHVGFNMPLDAAGGAEVARAALDMSASRYAFASLAKACGRAAARAYLQFGGAPPPGAERRYYCSSLVVQAYLQGAQVNLDHLQQFPSLPVSLSAHPDMASQRLYWTR